MMLQGLTLGLLLLGFADGTPNSGTKSNEKGSDSVEKAELSTGKKIVWTPEMDQITCCNSGTPTVPENLVRNFTIIPSDYTIEERTVDDVTMNCRDYEVHYLAQRRPELTEPDGEFDTEIKLRCKCADLSPSHTLDANCRRLLSCKNNGFRSSSLPHQCICPQPFFGERCEKYCDQGQRLKGHSGRDYCSCVPFYQGEECRDMVCLNGGREENGRCICLQQYLGYHCEINTNHTGPGGSRFQRFGDQSMYLLLKHRMQTRYLNRRSDLLSACNFPVPASMNTTSGHGSNNCLSAGRRVDLIEDPRLYSFRSMAGALPDNGPPPYFQNRGRRGAREVLPPLPSYEDATKLPPLRNNIPNDESVESIEETTGLSTRSICGNQFSHNDQTSSTVLSANSETIVATVRGTEMVRPAVINRQLDTGSIDPITNENAETMSLNSSASGSSSSSATSVTSSKPEQR